MKELFTLLLIFTNLCLLAQNKVTIVGEIRYGDNAKFRYREATKINLSNKSFGINDTATFNLKAIYKKEKYDKPPGTEIAFEIPYDLYKKTTSSYFNKTLKVNCTFYYPYKNTFDKVTLLLEVNLGNVDSYNDKTAKLGEPITLGAPERLTLTMIINDINEDFYSFDKQDSGYKNTVKKLDRYFDNFYNSKKIDYNSMIDFYRLLVYTDKYVNENSFFRKEGENLKQRIDEINKKLADPLVGNKSNLYDKLDLIQEINISNQIYQDYQTMLGKLTDYNSRLKLILFLKTK